MFEEIKALKELLDMGAITQEDFDRKKSELLSQPIAAKQVPNAPRHVRSSTAPEAGYEKSKIAAGLLAIFLGTLGIHKFYLGYSTQGIVMLLVSLFGFFVIGLGTFVIAIISLIEGIIYLTKSDADFEATYVRGSKGWF